MRWVSTTCANLLNDTVVWPSVWLITGKDSPGRPEMREALWMQLKTHEFLDPLRDDPRFQYLLRRMKFPE